jgi:hypothetical protein
VPVYDTPSAFERVVRVRMSLSVDVAATVSVDTAEGDVVPTAKWNSSAVELRWRRSCEDRVVAPE